MTESIEEISDELLALPVEARAKIAHKLILSLDEEEVSEIEASWAQEAKRRSNELKEGRVKGILAEDAIRMVRESLK